MKHYVENFLREKNIELYPIINAFEQTIIETYSSIRKLYNLQPYCDTIYSCDTHTRRKHRALDINYNTRISLITDEVYKILYNSIINGNIDIFLNPLAYKNQQAYLQANISSNFKITDTLFTHQELQHLSLSIPSF